jgi:hypothetical protein
LRRSAKIFALNHFSLPNNWRLSPPISGCESGPVGQLWDLRRVTLGLQRKSSPLLLYMCGLEKTANGTRALLDSISRILRPRLVRILAPRAASAPGRWMRYFAQLGGEKSPVPKRSKIRGNLAELSKGILGFTISKFESWQPSRPVPSPCRNSVREKCLRCFRMRAREGRSPTSKIGADGVPIAAIWRRISNREFSISEICSPRLGSYLVETGLHVRYRPYRMAV